LFLTWIFDNRVLTIKLLFKMLLLDKIWTVIILPI
jgi:hypothetical protein